MRLGDFWSSQSCECRVSRSASDRGACRGCLGQEQPGQVHSSSSTCDMSILASQGQAAQLSSPCHILWWLLAAPGQ